MRGALDAATAEPFRAEAQTRVGEDHVVIDLASCTFLDSAGVGALIGAVRRIREAGGDVEVAGASGAVARTLDACGATHYLDLTEPERRAPESA